MATHSTCKKFGRSNRIQSNLISDLRYPIADMRSIYDRKSDIGYHPNWVSIISPYINPSAGGMSDFIVPEFPEGIPLGPIWKGKATEKRKTIVELPQCELESHRTGYCAMYSSGVKFDAMALKLVIKGNKMVCLWF